MGRLVLVLCLAVDLDAPKGLELPSAEQYDHGPHLWPRAVVAVVVDRAGESPGQLGLVSRCELLGEMSPGGKSGSLGTPSPRGSC